MKIIYIQQIFLRDKTVTVFITGVLVSVHKVGQNGLAIPSPAGTLLINN
jgi:hypothetical protein